MAQIVWIGIDCSSSLPTNECEGGDTKVVEKGSSPPEGNGPWELQKEDVVNTRNLYRPKED